MMNRMFYRILNVCGAALLFLAACAADAGSLPVGTVAKMVFGAIVLLLYSGYRLSRRPCRRLRMAKPVLVPRPRPDEWAA